MEVETTPTVGFEAVGKRFGDREILRDINLSFSGPRVIGIIGDNGAGKTTLLRLIAGILRPTSGTIQVFDRAPSTFRELSATRIGALIEKPGHYEEESVFENLLFFYSFYFLASDKELLEAVKDSLEKSGLKAVEDQRVASLSFGFRQRLALARAFHPKASLLLLDEPFDSLDPGARSDFRKIVAASRNQNKLVLFSSHNLSEIEGLCEDIVFVGGGRAKLIGNFESVRRKVGATPLEDLDAVYGRLSTLL